MEVCVDGAPVEASRHRRTCPAGPAAPQPRPHHPGHHAGRPAVVGVDPAGRPDERAADPRLQAASRAQGHRASATSSPAKESATAPASTRRRSMRSTSPTGSAPHAPPPRTRPTTAASSRPICRPTTTRWRCGAETRSATSRSNSGPTAEAARLTELRLAAMTERAQLALALGRHQEVVGDLEPVVAHDPTLESLAGLLMLALYRSGRQADALDVYTRTREVLDESLGLEPSVSLRSLHERVLRQDASPRRPAGHGPRPRRSRRAEPPRHLLRADDGVSRRRPGRRSGAMPAHRSAPRRTGRRRRTCPPSSARSSAATPSSTPSPSCSATFGCCPSSAPAAPARPPWRSPPSPRRRRTTPTERSGCGSRRSTRPDQVPVAVADALGMPVDGAAASRDLRERLISFLSQRRMLLLIDNCEHVVDAAAVLDRRHPQPLPRTSPSSPPAAKRSPSPTRCRSPSARWRRPRRTRAGRGARTTRRRSCSPNAPAPCARGWSSTPTTCPRSGASAASLDGIPLALELAAARVVDAVAGRGVRTGSRTGSPCSPRAPAPPRSGSRPCGPRSTGATSCCRETEQRVFDRLSVFQGGWTLTSAEDVVGRRGALPGAGPRHHRPARRTVDGRGRARPHHQVPDAGDAAPVRRRTTRRRPGQAIELARRHAPTSESVVEHAEVGLRGHGQRQTLRLLHDEQPNIRAALAFLEAPTATATPR